MSNLDNTEQAIIDLYAQQTYLAHEETGLWKPNDQQLIELSSSLELTPQVAATYAFLGKLTAREWKSQLGNEIATMEAGIYE